MLYARNSKLSELTIELLLTSWCSYQLMSAFRQMQVFWTNHFDEAFGTESYFKHHPLIRVEVFKLGGSISRIVQVLSFMKAPFSLGR